MQTRLLTYADYWRLTFIVLCAGIFILIAPVVGLRVDWSSLTPVYAMAGVLAVIGLAYRALGRDEGIATATLVVAQIVVYSNVAVLDNYLGLELRRPTIDPLLAQADISLGLDWWGYVCWVKSLPFFGGLLTFAYNSSLPQVAITVILLGFTQRFDRLDQFTVAFMLSSATTIAIWTMAPSFGALVLHYAQGLPDPPFHLAVTKEEALKLVALHQGPTPTLRLEDLVGMIACPSFHTALAVLTMFGLWRVPYVARPAIAWNIIVLASIPADGGHHFVDIAAGALVTGLSLYLARAIIFRRNAHAQADAGAPAPLGTTLPA